MDHCQHSQVSKQLCSCAHLWLLQHVTFQISSARDKVFVGMVWMDYGKRLPSQALKHCFSVYVQYKNVPQNTKVSGQEQDGYLFLGLMQIIASFTPFSL